MELTNAQENTLQNLNDKYGVDRWDQGKDSSSIIVTLDDGTLVEVTEEGYRIWEENNGS